MTQPATPTDPDRKPVPDTAAAERRRDDRTIELAGAVAAVQATLSEIKGMVAAIGAAQHASESRITRIEAAVLHADQSAQSSSRVHRDMIEKQDSRLDDIEKKVDELGTCVTRHDTKLNIARYVGGGFLTVALTLGGWAIKSVGDNSVRIEANERRVSDKIGDMEIRIRIQEAVDGWQRNTPTVTKPSTPP